MASVRKRKKSKFWTACITLPDGTRKQFATGLEDRAEAQAAATAAERAFGKAPSPQRLRVSLDRVVEDFAQGDTVPPGEWLETWAERRRKEVAPATFDKYKITAKEAASYLSEVGVDRFAGITSQIVEDMRDRWAEERAPSTANGKLKILRMALGRAVREKLLETNPAERVSNLKTEAVRRREFKPAEIEIVLSVLEGEWRALFMLGLYTGQRLNDLASLRWQNLDLSARVMAFTAQKTGATIALPLLDPAVDALTALPATDDPTAYVFPRVHSKSRTTRSNEFRALLAQVGLATHYKEKRSEAGRRTPSELSFHSLRHTTTTLLKAAGVSDAIARAIIGHESAEISRQYTHLDLETMRENMERIQP